jgi:hypothetical protein
VRCRRESKRCEFSSTRRKRKTSDAEPEADGPLRRDKRMMVGEALYGDSTNIASNATTKRESSFGPAVSAPFDNGSLHKYSWPEHSPGAASQPSPTVQKDRHQPSPMSSGHFHDGRSLQPSAYRVHSQGLARTESRQTVMNKTAADLLFPTISNSHDALHLLSEAAGRTEDLNRQRLENRARQSAASYGNPMSASSSSTPRNAHHPYPKRPNQIPADGYGDSGSSEYRKQSFESHSDPGYLDAVKAWSRLRFVRAGWLSVEEAMAYIA